MTSLVATNAASFGKPERSRDIQLHKSNIKKMIDGGASRSQINSYLSGEGITAAQLKNSAPNQRDRLQELRTNDRRQLARQELARRELARRKLARKAIPSSSSQPIVASERSHSLPPELQQDVNNRFQESIDKTGPIGRAIGGGFASLAHDASFGAGDLSLIHISEPTRPY